MSKMLKSTNILALAIWVALFWVSAFMKSGKEKEYNRLVNEWFIVDWKMNYDKINTWLNDKRKKYFIEELIFNNWNNISATINWDRLLVVSRNEDIQWKWIIPMIVNLDLLTALWVNVDKIDFEYKA